MRSWGKICCIAASAFLLCGCTKKEKTEQPEKETYFLESYISCSNEVFQPGKLSWGISKEEVIEKMALSEKEITSQNSEELQSDLKVSNLGKGDLAKVRYNFEEKKLDSIDILVEVQSKKVREKVFGEFLKWGRTELPVPDVDTEIWNEEDKTILETYLQAEEDMRFIWNGSDLSYCAVNLDCGEKSSVLWIRTACGRV